MYNNAEPAGTALEYRRENRTLFGFIPTSRIAPWTNVGSELHLELGLGGGSFQKGSPGVS